MDILTVCKTCGTKFAASSWQKKNKGGQFCSRKCQYKGVDLVEYKCPTCDKIFHRKPWQMSRSRTGACSKECAFAASRKTLEQKYKNSNLKKCPSCKEILPLENFHIALRESSGRNVYCKKCQSARNKKYKTNVNTKRALLKAKFILQKGNKCNKCGVENLPICCYEFHHRDHKEKEFTISLYLSGKKANLQNELDKCDLLCSYCHSIEHAKYSNLPATEYDIIY